MNACLPVHLKGLLSGEHDVDTVVSVGWNGSKNGDLLRAANDRFDVLVTSDGNMFEQQSFAGLDIAVVVLPANNLRLVREAVPALLQSLGRIERGQRVVMDLDRVGRWSSAKLCDVRRDGDVLRHVFEQGE